MRREVLLQTEAQQFRRDGSAKAVLDSSIEKPDSSPLGQIVTKTDIRCLANGKGGIPAALEFRTLPEYRIQYPDVVVRALGNLYREYNTAFEPLVEVNREWDTDYQHAMDEQGMFVNGWVQVDMVGLPKDFLDETAEMSTADVQEALRSRIFEIENSIAMYQLLQRLFSKNGESTFFNTHFRRSLDQIRARYNRPVALLAVTDEKYKGMREIEFGKMDGEQLSDEEVYELSGFDRFFGPEDFMEYLIGNNGECGYLLFARTSHPVAKLKKPDMEVDVPLLAHPATRKIIKANAITFNIDSPNWDNSDPRIINDTKAWMSSLGMALDVFSYEDIEAEDQIRDERGKLKPTSRATSALTDYLESQGIDLLEMEPRDVLLHAKPMKASYGCYGHTAGTLKDHEFRRVMKKGIRERGPYVLQPQMQTPVIINETDGNTYTYIDRNFLYLDGPNTRFMGGVRSLMPIDSVEARAGRNHGSKFTVSAEIKPDNI